MGKMFRVTNRKNKSATILSEAEVYGPEPSLKSKGWLGRFEIEEVFEPAVPRKSFMPPADIIRINGGEQKTVTERAIENVTAPVAPAQPAREEKKKRGRKTKAEVAR